MAAPSTRVAPRSSLVVATALALACYLLIVPPVPDLAAQFTRAEIVRQAGVVVWWPGWFGGSDLPTYSVLVPAVMAVLGVPLTGALAALVSIVTMRALLRDTARPALGAAVFAAMVLLNLFGGRTTFLAGVAVALLAVRALVARRPALAVALGVLTCLASPLAALFLGIAAVATAVGDRSRRRQAVLLAAGVAATAGTLALLFSSPGTMTAPPWQMLAALAGAGVVAVVCGPGPVRVGAVVLLLATAVETVLPSAVGLNITRMTWLLAAPLIVAVGVRRAPVIAALAVLASLFPAIDTAQQVGFSQDASASAAYYAPLLAELRRQVDADPAARGMRIEAVEPRTKGAARFVAPEFPIARGWNRQVDQALNPLFYGDGELTAASYEAWLAELAVGWVAVPAAPLDSAAIAEAQLVGGGLPYLSPVWESSDWVLYRVAGSRPIVPGAQVVSVADGTIEVAVPAAGEYPMRLRWSRHLQVEAVEAAAAAGVDAAAVVCPDSGGEWSVLQAPAAGTYAIASGFRPLAFAAGPPAACARP